MRRECTLGRFVLACAVLTLLSTNTHLAAFPGGGAAMMQDPILNPVQNSAVTTFLRAECIVIGKVRSIETEPAIAATTEREKFKTVFKVAVIAVDETLAGDKSAKTVRVGFRIINKNYKNPLPGLAPLHLTPPSELEVGQEGYFVLVKHYEQPFFLMPGSFGFDGQPRIGGDFGGDGTLIKKGTPLFESDVAMMKRCSKLMEDPKAALKSKDVEERLLATAILITKYRTPPPMDLYLRMGVPLGQPAPIAKMEPIDAVESRLILEALALADLNRATDAKLKISALGLFNKLGLTKADGWDPNETDAARKWLKANADKYRIQRFVSKKTSS
jgi:hypothetical protein